MCRLINLGLQRALVEDAHDGDVAGCHAEQERRGLIEETDRVRRRLEHQLRGVVGAKQLLVSVQVEELALGYLRVALGRRLGGEERQIADLVRHGEQSRVEVAMERHFVIF